MIGGNNFASTSSVMYFSSTEYTENHQNAQMENRKPEKREKRKYRCRKRSPATIERAKMVRRDKANARERRRMNSLNDALEHLRTILPALPDEPKMTKIETLRKAQEYIASLSYQLTSSGESSTATSPDYPPTQPVHHSFSSNHSTPFQSPCFPPPPNYSTAHFHQEFYSPHFPDA